MRASKIQLMEDELIIMANQLSNRVIQFKKNGDIEAAIATQVQKMLVDEIIDKCLKIKNKEK